MNRRSTIKILTLSVAAPEILIGAENNKLIDIARQFARSSEDTHAYHSQWQNWPDMKWIGPEYWGNRLQDWSIKDGKAQCLVRGQNRALYSLVCQLTDRLALFSMSVIINFLDQDIKKKEDSYAGFRLGAKHLSGFDEYRSAAVFGIGLDAGIGCDGRLFIGKKKSEKILKSNSDYRLTVKAKPIGDSYELSCMVSSITDNQLLDEIFVKDIEKNQLIGNVALVCHYAKEDVENLGFRDSKDFEEIFLKQPVEKPSVSFSDWIIEGKKVEYSPEQTFGPICFCQYTINKGVLKLVAQLAPVETITGQKIVLQAKKGNTWIDLQEKAIESEGRSVHFRLENWDDSEAIPYRVRLDLPLKDELNTSHYEGTIAAQPKGNAKLKVAVFSCNCDHGFPDTEVVVNSGKHQADMAVFLGDQFYESHGGFGIQTSSFEKASLDYLRKWYMFGWSYRDIFRHIPCAIIPDDHDVYHGNIWGEGGDSASSAQGWAAVAQDLGGYKMPPQWVNMVQRTQTGHLPDPFNPEPVKQGISVYYTTWNYGGVSFAILEDRKFKSAPKHVLPEEAMVENGFIRNPDFDITKFRDIKAELLGSRQLDFLKQWSEDWTDGVKMKVVLSQTNFCTVATLPEGTIGDEIVPTLSMPDPDVYVIGDAVTVDMDSNGWPQKGRDDALRLIRKCFAFHIAGDQHLASMVQYGLDEFGDSGFAFAGPALNNMWPRRWWPPLKNSANKSLIPTQQANLGNFYDGFGNRMTVRAVANPRKTGKQPAIVYDRSTGYGIVVIDSKDRMIHTECWPRDLDPIKQPSGQYTGWPLAVSQEQNYGRKAVAWLPQIKVNGTENPVIEIIQEVNNELVYTLRLKGKTFKPKVFSKGNYTIRVSDPDKMIIQERKNISAKIKNNKTILFSV